MLTSDQNGSKPCNTATKQRKLGVPFVKGDPRINRKGRPKSFDEVRSLAQELAHEVGKNGREEIINVLESWRDSKEPQLQKAFVEYAFGKVPDKIDATMEHKSRLYLNYSHEESNVREDNARLSPSVSPGAN